ncbi:hypothetical protein KUCAC02_033720, partial [Chaenocephalus aceratus]
NDGSQTLSSNSNDLWLLALQNIEKWFNNAGHDPLALEHRPSITLDESLRGETPASVCNVSRSSDESIAQSKRSNKVFQKACFDSDMRSLSEDSKGRKSSICYDLRSFSAERWSSRDPNSQQLILPQRFQKHISTSTLQKDPEAPARRLDLRLSLTVFDVVEDDELLPAQLQKFINTM